MRTSDYWFRSASPPGGVRVAVFKREPVPSGPQGTFKHYMGYSVSGHRPSTLHRTCFTISRSSAISVHDLWDLSRVNAQS